ncbi:MAG: hypothetical protein GY940_20720 [bacterium]|nr:hypothetical protein [bacterium]
MEMINTVKHEGYIIGSNFDREEVYIQAFSPVKGKYALVIADIRTGEVKKEMPLTKGGFEGPTDFYNPSYMQFVNGNYLLVDQFHKIMVYDEQLNYRYTNMFYKLRYFIDFFPMENQIGFVIGEHFPGLKLNTNYIQLFKMSGNRKPNHKKDLYVFQFKSLSFESRQSKKFVFTSGIWPSGNGFEKDGNVYYANFDEQRYLVYNIGEDKTIAFALNYLKPKTFSLEAAKKINFYHSSGLGERAIRRSGKRYKVVLYPKPMYHFGIHDVGDKKIGIIGDLDIDNFQFRLDILDTVSGAYLESIRLPFGVGFKESISTGARGLHHIYFDMDKGYYLWNNSEGEDLIDYARITRFKILRKTENQGPNKDQ